MVSNLPEDYERILLVKPDVSVYKIGVRPNARGYRAADWKLDTADWNGRMRIVSKSVKCIIRLEDKMSGQLFGECPIEEWPSVAVESVVDSSRYFVIRLMDRAGSGSDRHAFIGLGFSDRADSFDFNVAIADHFKWLKQSKEIERQDKLPQPQVDRALKDGQTITINLKNKSGDGASWRRDSDPKPKASVPFTGILPPPPGVKATSKDELGPMWRAGGTPMPQNVPAPSPVNLKHDARSGGLLDDTDVWGSFSSSSSTAGGSSNETDQNNWVSFS